MEVRDAKHRRGVRVQLLLSILIVVTLALETHADTARHVLDTQLPDLLVELGVKTHVVRAHRLLRKLDDFLHTPGSALLELPLVHTLVQVDGVLTLFG